MRGRSTHRRVVSAVSYGCAAALGVACLVVGSSRSAPAAADEHRWGHENAAWARITLRHLPQTSRRLTQVSGEAAGPQVLSETMAADLAQRLRSGNIKYLYLFVGPFGPDGRLPAYPFSERVQRSLRMIRERHPEAVLLPWVGGIQGKQLRLEDLRWVAAAIGEIARLIDALGVNGVHVDFENVLRKSSPDPDYPGHVNRFFRELRRRLPHAFISTVIPSTAPGVKPWKQQHSVTEADELVGLVNQMAVLYYDTSIQDSRTFEENLAIQIDHFARWKAVARHTQLLVAVGTFVNGGELRRYRNRQVESIERHFTALARATARHPRQLVDGSAIYCEWQTDASEWSRLRPFLEAATGKPRETAVRRLPGRNARRRHPPSAPGALGAGPSAGISSA